MDSKYGQSARAQLIDRLKKVQSSNQFPDQNTKGIRTSKGRGIALKGLKKVKINPKARGGGASASKARGGGKKPKKPKKTPNPKRSAWHKEIRAMMKAHPGVPYGQAMSMAKAARCEKRGGAINEPTGPDRGGAINEPTGPDRGGVLYGGADISTAGNTLREKLMNAYQGGGRSGGSLVDQVVNLDRGGGGNSMYWPQDARPLYGGGNEVSTYPNFDENPDDARRFYATGGVLDGESAAAYMLGGQLVDNYYDTNGDQSLATSYNDFRVTYPDYSDRPLNNFEGFPRQLKEASKRSNEFFDRPNYEALQTQQPPYRQKRIPFPTYLP